MVGEISSSHLCCLHVSLHLVTGSDCHKIKQHSASAHWPLAREQKWVNLGWHAAALWGSKSDRQVEGHPVCPSHTWKPSWMSSGLSPKWSMAFQTSAHPWQSSGPGDLRRNCWFWKRLRLYICQNKRLGLHSLLLNKNFITLLAVYVQFRKSTWE